MVTRNVDSCSGFVLLTLNLGSLRRGGSIMENCFELFRERCLIFDRHLYPLLFDKATSLGRGADVGYGTNNGYTYTIEFSTPPLEA